MRRLSLLVAFVVCCGSFVAGTGHPALAFGSACSLMSRADVEAVLHTTVGSGSPLAGSAAEMLPRGATSCVYSPPGAGQLAMVASITVTRAGSSMYDTMFHNYQAPPLVSMGAPQPISGLGEKAFYEPVGRQFVVYAKGYLINIAGSSIGVRQGTQLARRVLARL